MIGSIGRLLALLTGLGAVAGCSMVTVTSEPPGAEITYSPTGRPPWKPWPPDHTEARETPARQITSPEPFYYLRVNKEGYYPVFPEFVDVGILGRQRLHFVLEPTPQTRGYVWYEDRWVKPEEEGIVEYRGRWVPADEKFVLEQRERGLVEFDGQWMTPQEKADRIAARKRAEGLDPFKGRWLEPKDVEREQLIDQEAERLARSEGTFPVLVERISSVVDARTTGLLHVANIMPYRLEVLLSGPESRRLSIGARGRATIELPAGSYVMVIREVDRPTAPVGVSVIELAAKTRYLAYYFSDPGRHERLE